MSLQEERQRRTARIGAYGMVKEAQIRSALPPEEQQELEDLEALRRRSAAQETRLEELWAKAFRDHVPPQAVTYD